SASILGFRIGFPLTKTLFGELSSGLILAGVNDAVVGAIAGALQWLVLRGRVGRAGWWVLASTLAWMLSTVLDELGALAAGEEFVADLLRVILGAALSGAGMVWLLRQAAPGAQADAGETAHIRRTQA